MKPIFIATMALFPLGVGLQLLGFHALSSLPMFAGFYLLGRIDGMPDADGEKP